MNKYKEDKNLNDNHITLHAHFASEDLDNCAFTIHFEVPNTHSCTDEENIHLLQIALHKLLYELDKKNFKAELIPSEF